MKFFLKFTLIPVFIVGIFGLPHGESCKLKTHEKLKKNIIFCESYGAKKVKGSNWKGRLFKSNLKRKLIKKIFKTVKIIALKIIKTNFLELEFYFFCQGIRVMPKCR